MGESPRGFESLTLRMIVKKSAQYHKYLARFLIFLLGTFGVTYYYTLFSSAITKHLIVFNVLQFFYVFTKEHQKLGYPSSRYLLIIFCSVYQNSIC